MDKRKRIVAVKQKGLFMRYEFGFLPDSDFEVSLKALSKTLNVDEEDFITYTLGTEDKLEEGYLYFCPRCGEYNEFGYKPEVQMYYRQGMESEEMEPVGYFKRVVVDCPDCEEAFYVHTDKFDQESKILSEGLGDLKGLET